MLIQPPNMNPSPIHRNRVGKKRTSCDRCHTLKSKCTRTPGSERCNRCERIGIRCVFSATMKLGRPKSLQVFQPPPNQFDKAIEQQSLTPRDIHHAEVCMCREPHAACASSSGISTAPLSAPTAMREQWPGHNMTPPGSPSLPLHIASQLHGGDSAIYELQAPFNYDEPSVSIAPAVETTLHPAEIDFAWLLDSSGPKALTGQIPQDASHMGFDSTSLSSSPAPNSAPGFSEAFTSPSDCSYTGDMNSPMYKLSKLHLELDNLLSLSINCDGTVHPNDLMSSPSSPFSAAIAIPTTPTTPTTAIDEIFLLSETLIKIVQELYQEATTTMCQPLSIYPFTPQSSPLRRRGSSNSQDSYKSGRQQEPATILLTLTCYLRLLGIYETLVVPLYQYFQQHRPQFKAHPNSSFPLPLPLPIPSLPTFKLGRYGLTATSSMNLGLLLHLLLRTLECLHSTVSLYLSTTSPSPHSRWAYDGNAPPSSTKSPTSASDYAESGFISPMRDNGQHDDFSASLGIRDHVTLLTESALSEAGRREKYLTGLLHSVMETLPAIK
ncbi:hypothetical protein BDDG_02434 [Blastomyces dermatitidis ATCC 18188]|uniref:Zn(2)-C6 fungal-type domain-containing protein n=1 Tax=Ajellomyces dermatitidis (strain ATCC 18188 / CBS 674.68) TaxID=653446 RepID=F2T8D0_AJEDA|nr:hypothetical protein BDDG_02434 [Blastomyces dermatitidis ATCC 18188]